MTSKTLKSCILHWRFAVKSCKVALNKEICSQESDKKKVEPFKARHNSPRARKRFNQVVEAKRFEGVFLCRKVC